MGARYLIRLDDACPTMRKSTWHPLVSALIDRGIRPLVGVIPENRDASLKHSEPDPNFWQMVRDWQRNGWLIAMHGLHHEYQSIPKESKALLTRSRISEFAGRSLEEQRLMIRRGLQCFERHDIEVKVFMAPNHSFDANTLLALEAETTVEFIADGHAIAPYWEGRFIWIPQQLWHLRPLPFGFWSVCLHPNTLREADIESLIASVDRYAESIVDARTIGSYAVEKRRLIDHIAGRAYAAALAAKQPRLD
jgi:predicted deacetylase